MVKRKLQNQVSGSKGGKYRFLKGKSALKPAGSAGKIMVKKPNSGDDRMLAKRYEKKYVISESMAAAVVKYVQAYMDLDRYSKIQPKGAYPIVSLYMDSNDMRFCRESLRGHLNRIKLRIRSYTDSPEYPQFFEIKRRANTVIMKSRARVMSKDVANLLTGLPLPPSDYKTDEEVLNQFQFYTRSIHAVPIVLIRYMRKAFEGESENRVRVTFDSDLCYKITREPKVVLGGNGWQRNPVGGVILEIKFTGRYPAWLTEMVRFFNLLSCSMSKYTTSIMNSYSLGFCAPAMVQRR